MENTTATTKQQQKTKNLNQVQVAINSEIRYKANLQTDRRAQSSLTFNYCVENLSLSELAERIRQRHSITAVCFNSEGRFHRAKADFKALDIGGVDIDNDDGGAYVTIDEALRHPFIRENCAIAYTTASHTEDLHKYRLLFAAPFTITNIALAEEFIAALMWKITREVVTCDEACSDASRFFYGTGENGQVVIVNDRRMHMEAFNKLLSEYRGAMHPEPKKEAPTPKHTMPHVEFDAGYIFSEDAEDRRDQYRARAIQTATKMIDDSRPGNRHLCRRNAARLLGGYVAGGFFALEEARQILSDVVARNTDNHANALHTVEDGLTDGLSMPFTFEALEAERAAYLERTAANFKPTPSKTPTQAADERREAKEQQRTDARAMTNTIRTEREVSEVFDVMNFIFSRAKAPAKVRAFLLAVTGLVQEKAQTGNEAEQFQAHDYEVGLRLRNDDEDKPDEFMTAAERAEMAAEEGLPVGVWRKKYENRRSSRIKKNAQRYRKETEEWQKKTGYVFMICESGGRTKDKQNESSRYQVPLLKEATEALIQARARRTTDPKRAIRIEAKAALSRLEGTYNKVERFRRKGSRPDKVREANEKLILTKFKKNLELTAIMGEDPQTYRERLLAQIDGIMAELGFAVDEAVPEIHAPDVHIDLSTEEDMDKPRSAPTQQDLDDWNAVAAEKVQIRVDKTVPPPIDCKSNEEKEISPISSKTILQNENRQIVEKQTDSRTPQKTFFESEKTKESPPDPLLSALLDDLKEDEELWRNARRTDQKEGLYENINHAGRDRLSYLIDWTLLQRFCESVGNVQKTNSAKPPPLQP